MAGIIKKLKKAKVGRKATNSVNKAVAVGKEKNVVRKIQNTSARVGTVAGKIDKGLDNPLIKAVALSNPYSAAGYVGARAALGGTQQLAGGVNKGARFSRSDEGKKLIAKSVSEAKPVVKMAIQKAKPLIKEAKKTYVEFV
tara:strand:- start:3655 stop:4077 length:423 start_codon:yes stop_codon:yes gene_type:complete